MNPPAPSALEVRDLVCQRDAVAVRVERLAFAPGTFHLLLGEAGSGHELLLRVLGLLETPDAGELVVEGEPIAGLDEDARRKLRERRLGFVFTAPFLLPALSVIENVAMPLFKVSGVDLAAARERSEALLAFAGLAELGNAPCGELAPLAQHRVSLARALANEPAALLVESLDSALAGEDLDAFAALLRQAVGQFGLAVIATASPRFVAAPDDFVIEVSAGNLSPAHKLLPKSEV